MPNGELHDIYGDSVISAGKNKGKIRYNYPNAKVFEVLNQKPSRIKILYWNQNMSENIKNSISTLRDLYELK